MNIIDIIIIIALVVSIFLGLKDGAIRQIGTLIGIIAAIILAKAFGSTVSSYLGIGGDYADIWGYVIVLIASLIAVAFAASLLRKIVKAVGLGIIDRLAGGAVAAIKCSLILAILFSLFAMINTPLQLVEEELFEESMLYAPVTSTSKYIAPTIEWVGDQIPEIESKILDNE